MERSKISMQKWVIAIYLHMTSLKGVSSMKLHRDIGVTQKTAWFMLQRIREAFRRDDDDDRMGGPVEVDENHVGGQRRNMSKSKRKDPHESICHSAGEYVKGMAHTNGNGEFLGDSETGAQGRLSQVQREAPSALRHRLFGTSQRKSAGYHRPDDWSCVRNGGPEAYLQETHCR